MAADKSMPLSALKEHVVQSQCMKIQSWMNAGCTTLYGKGKLPYSFSSVILQCAELEAIDLSLCGIPVA